MKHDEIVFDSALGRSDMFMATGLAKQLKVRRSEIFDSIRTMRAAP